MIKQIAAGFVVWRIENGKRLYLLLKHIAGHWSFAKGRTEQGESLEAAARRELKEETGIIDVTIVGQLPEPTVYMTTDHGQSVQKTLYLFAAHTPEKTVTLSPEHTDYGWFAYEEALAEVMHEATRQALAIVNKL